MAPEPSCDDHRESQSDDQLDEVETHVAAEPDDPFYARLRLKPALQEIVERTTRLIKPRLHAAISAHSSWKSSMSTNHETHDSNSRPPPVAAIGQRTARLLVIVEGGYDVHFLKRISTILHADDNQIPDLCSLEKAGLLVFVPIGGSNFCHWTHRLAGLGLPEFHLYDREISPLTEERQKAADVVNRRPGCRAVLTGKRAMENYLDSQSLQEIRGLEITFGDQDDVPQLVARRLLERAGGPDWSALPSRSRRRLKDLAKRWLNTDAVSRMTPDRLAMRDPEGDIRSWLTTIAEMADCRGVRATSFR